MSPPPFPVRRGLTLWFGLALALWAAASAGLYLDGGRGLAAHIALSGPALYFLCICVHDAVHGVMCRSRGLNQLAGFGLSLVILLPFPLLQSAHLTHHRRVGHDDDPEHVVYGVGLLALLVRLPLVPLYYLRSLADMRGQDRALTVLHIVLSGGASWALAQHVGVMGVVLGWWLPVLLTVMWFGFTTVYVPHSRYAARLMPHLTTHSGWHFDHHRDPRYPFSQYVQLRAHHLRLGIAPFGTPREQRVIGWLARPVRRS